MGGGAMRTAAKATAFAGYRSTATRRAPTMPRASSVSTVHVAIDEEPAPLTAAISSGNAPGHTAMVQWPAWDDWEFAGGQEGEAAALLDPPPRLVFGPAPTLEEATEATADLKEAIEKVYFFSGNAGDTVKVNEVSNIGESAAILPSMPKRVVQAFSLLQGSPDAQNMCNIQYMSILACPKGKTIKNGPRQQSRWSIKRGCTVCPWTQSTSVVASLACDKNVWDAVMKNDKVLEFYSKQQSVIPPPETNDAPIRDDLGLVGLFSETVESPDEETSEGSAFFTDFVQTIKEKVSEMVSSISCFLQDFMGTSSGNHGTTNAGTSTSSSADYANLAHGSYFIALAVATILVVLLKRS